MTIKVRFRAALFSLSYISAFIISALLLFSCASSRETARAEEYFSLGMAYYDLGKYTEAERWLSRAAAADKTMTASSYNLGRIAFETGRYEEAARHFERILGRDPNNVMALKAAAFSRIKNGNLAAAEAHYDRVLTLVPESADDGFNYALVLYSLNKFQNCEDVLTRYPHAMEENPLTMLLFARAQKAQNKIEAADSYAKWLIVHTGAANPQGIYEYAQVLESAGLYALAIEQYGAAISALTRDTDELKKSTLRYEKARLLLTADPENTEGIKELSAALADGFSNQAALEYLLNDERISEANRTEIRSLMTKTPSDSSSDTEAEN